MSTYKQTYMHMDMDKSPLHLLNEICDRMEKRPNAIGFISSFFWENSIDVLMEPDVTEAVFLVTAAHGRGAEGVRRTARDEFDRTETIPSIRARAADLGMRTFSYDFSGLRATTQVQEDIGKSFREFFLANSRPGPKERMAVLEELFSRRPDRRAALERLHRFLRRHYEDVPEIGAG